MDFLSLAVRLEFETLLPGVLGFFVSAFFFVLAESESTAELRRIIDRVYEAVYSCRHSVRTLMQSNQATPTERVPLCLAPLSTCYLFVPRASLLIGRLAAELHCPTRRRFAGHGEA